MPNMPSVCVLLQIFVIFLCYTESHQLNVYAEQKPRQHVVLIEIQPNRYNDYFPQTAGVNLHSLG
jgi:hypothetical protein